MIIKIKIFYLPKFYILFIFNIQYYFIQVKWNLCVPCEIFISPNILSSTRNALLSYKFFLKLSSSLDLNFMYIYYSIYI